MHLLFSGSIRKILIWLVFLSVLPALFIILYSGLGLRRNAIENANREVLFLARTMGEVQKGITRSTHQILATLSHTSEIRSLDTRATSAILSALIDKNPIYHNIVAMDARGEVFASGRPFEPTNLADRYHVGQALKRKTFSVGEYIVTRIGEPIASLAFALPVLDDRDELVAMLAATLNLAHFSHFFDVARLPQDSFVSVVDRKGIQLFSHPRDKASDAVGEPISETIWGVVRNAESPGIYRHDIQAGVRQFTAYHPVRLANGQPPYIYMLVCIPEASVLENANAILVRNLLLMAAVALLALAISWLVGNKVLVSPINRLVAATRAFAGGDLETRNGFDNMPGELGTLATAFDEMADTLIKSRETLRTIADYTFDWEYWVGLEGRLMWVSPACEKISGYAPSAFLSDPSLLLRIVHASDASTFAQHHDRELSEEGAMQLDFRIVHKSGRTVWINHNCVPIVRPDGAFLGRRVSNRDITDRKQMETRLQQAQKMEAIGSLAGGIAHDFNNILFPITGMSELLLEDLPPGSQEREYVSAIYNAARRAGDLVNQILSFSRQAEHKKIPIRIQQVLKEVAKLTRATIPANIAIHWDVQADCTAVLADPTNVHQVAMNLITNALHAVEQTGGSITIGLKEITLMPEDVVGTPLVAGSYALLTVSDDGTGIAPEVMPKIFDPYFTTKEQGKGTGLGLSAVFGIVREHGGDIRIYSEVGQGTTCQVYIPLIRPQEAFEATVGEVVYTVGTERILLVDDEEPIAKIEKQMLERLGYAVTVRTSSVEALEAFKADPAAYDLIITDMAMPNLTGDQLARQLISIRADIPIILCTGFSERMTMAKADALGIKAFLMKPVVKSDLALAIRKVLDETRQDRSESE
jgi:PAS domain S-box-containing protein